MTETKPKPHTREWLTLARERANLFQTELAERAGIHSNTVGFIEKGKRSASPAMWERIDEVLYPLVPAAYVNEMRLISDAEAYAHKEGKEALCRLFYMVSELGSIAFVDVRPNRDEGLSGPYVAVPWSAAIELLDAQRKAFGWASWGSCTPPQKQKALRLQGL